MATSITTAQWLPAGLQATLALRRSSLLNTRCEETLMLRLPIPVVKRGHAFCRDNPARDRSAAATG